MAALMAMALWSCGGGKSFSVSVKLPSETAAAYRLFYYASSGSAGAYQEVALPVTHGQYSGRCRLLQPAVVYVFSAAQQRPSTFFYAEPGDKVTLEGVSPQPDGWTIGGNAVNDSLSAWRSRCHDLLISGRTAQVSQAVAATVRDVKPGVYPQLLLLHYFDRRGREKEFWSLWAIASPHKASLPDALVPAPELTLGPPSAAALFDLTLHSYGQGVDTVKAKGKPTLLYFRRSSDPDREEDLAPVAELTESFPDSAKRHIVEIGLDVDSLTWVRPVRTDSLKKIIRAWMPMGFADDRAMRLQVTSTPYFIVADKKGRIIYRGPDSKKAKKDFQSLLKPKT